MRRVQLSGCDGVVESTPADKKSCENWFATNYVTSELRQPFHRAYAENFRSHLFLSTATPAGRAGSCLRRFRARDFTESHRSIQVATMSPDELYRDPVIATNTAISDSCIEDLMNHRRPVSLYFSAHHGAIFP
jgi:hypothetical protein